MEAEEVSMVLPSHHHHQQEVGEVDELEHFEHLAGFAKLVNELI